MTSLKFIASLIFALGLPTAGRTQQANNEVKLTPDTFESIHRQIKPQPGESRWMEIPWQTNLHEARLRAAAEGKPLFLMATGKAISLGMC